MPRKSIRKGEQIKLTTTSWHLRISVKQLKAILAVTGGYHRFAMVGRLGAECGDQERMQLMKKEAVRGGMKISHEEALNGHTNFRFYFTRQACRDSTGQSIIGEYCISQWTESVPRFRYPASPERRKLIGIPTFNAKTNWEWLKKYLKLR